MTARQLQSLGLLIFFLIILLIIRIIGCATVQQSSETTETTSTTAVSIPTTNGATTTLPYYGYQDYYPNTDGYSWTYLRHFSDKGDTQIEKITYRGTTQINFMTAQIAIRETVFQGNISTSESYFKVDNTAVYRTQIVANNTVLAPLFGFPLYVGKFSGVSTVTALEDVTVPAGTFTKCFKLTYTDADLTYNIWLAQNVGMVKAEKFTGSLVSTAELTGKKF